VSSFTFGDEKLRALQARLRGLRRRQRRPRVAGAHPQPVRIEVNLDRLHEIDRLRIELGADPDHLAHGHAAEVDRRAHREAAHRLPEH
jgi:hypothetical protein